MIKLFHYKENFLLYNMQRVHSQRDKNSFFRGNQVSYYGGEEYMGWVNLPYKRNLAFAF